jgi:4-diphosphocytidyl-2-C-methyl-D-erythritol kinase
VDLTLDSPAKTNLFLQILGRRPDGFHDLRTFMVALEFGDTLHFTCLDRPNIEISSTDPNLPIDQGNLIWKAARILQEGFAPQRGVKIHLVKRIPVGAGLGGGSSNGTITLVGLNQLWRLGLSDEKLEALAAEFGSDTAFFVRREPSLSEGRGESLTRVPFQQTWPLFLMNFGFGSATAWAYKNLRLNTISQAASKEEVLEGIKTCALKQDPWALLKKRYLLHNDLEKPVFGKFPILNLARDFLARQPGVKGAMMCGSGSTMMAVLENPEAGEALTQSVHQHFGPSVWCCRTSIQLPTVNRRQK